MLASPELAETGTGCRQLWSDHPDWRSCQGHLTERLLVAVGIDARDTSPSWPTVKLVSEPAEAPSVLVSGSRRRGELRQLAEVDVDAEGRSARGQRGMADRSAGAGVGADELASAVEDDGERRRRGATAAWPIRLARWPRQPPRWCRRWLGRPEWRRPRRRRRVAGGGGDRPRGSGGGRRAHDGRQGGRQRVAKRVVQRGTHRGIGRGGTVTAGRSWNRGCPSRSAWSRPCRSCPRRSGW